MPSGITYFAVNVDNINIDDNKVQLFYPLLMVGVDWHKKKGESNVSLLA